ncbi:MAG: nucleotide exchange factor GrpE [Sulfurospirillum sp.]|nr:MAG: nucleotide exchange factor GrpE [Sulfurospirillum sp.]
MSKKRGSKEEHELGNQPSKSGETNNSQDKLQEDQEIESLKEKVAELEDKYLREHADFENIKKRLEKEKAQAVAYANEQFARDLLSVIDSLDSALASVADEKEPSAKMFNQLKEGIELTINQFAKVFEKHGIELVSIDEGFDPNFHEAVMQVDSDDHKEGEIVQVLQKGYKMKDRLLRSAMVSIAK